MKLLDIGNTVERAVANATDFGVDFLTVHGHDLKTMRAAVTGRGTSKLKLLAVTVLTNLTADDLQQQGSSLSPADLVLRRAKLARESGFDGVIASGQEAGAHPRGGRPGLPHRHARHPPDRQRHRRPGAHHDPRPRHRRPAPTISSWGARSPRRTIPS